MMYYHVLFSKQRDNLIHLRFIKQFKSWKMFRKLYLPCNLTQTLIKLKRNYMTNAGREIQKESVQKLLQVAIIGMPNSGKSTLINMLMDRKVCPVSSKVHTTRGKATAIFTQDDSQIVFLDTPGLVNEREQKKHKLENSFVKDVRSSLHEADLIAVIHDVNSYSKDKLDIKVIKSLETYRKKKSVLILNKIDMLKSKRKLLDLTRLLTEGCIAGKEMGGIKSKRTTIRKTSNVDEEEDSTKIRGWRYFNEIFMVSALTGNGIDGIREYFIRKARPAEWLFPPDIYSDQLTEDIIINTVKAQLLDYLQQELPYSLIPAMEYFEVAENGAIKTVVLVKCPTERIKTLVAGAGDGRIKNITASIQNILQNAFNTRVSIQIVLHAPEKSN